MGLFVYYIYINGGKNMSLIGIFLIAVGLSMDAFAVAISKGITMKKLNMKNAIKIAGFFGLFQGVMPFIGWLVGVKFNYYVVKIDHWIAFILLASIGGKMVYEAYKNQDECAIDVASDEEDELSNKELFILAIATSIDALAVGVSFAFLQVEIVKSVIMIGVITFIISFIGVVMGRKLGCLFQKKAEIFGGIILVLIGTKILFEHTGFGSILLALFK
jgi:putative Mn2+ efflux pump MntP